MVVNMTKNIDQYIQASGADSEQTRELFDRLKSRMPSDISKDYKTAAKQIKHAVRELFGDETSYDRSNFLVQDVLEDNSANCLGLPLLIGALLGEYGFNPKIGLLITPKDKTYEMEAQEFERIKDGTRYDKPDLAERKKDLPLYRFTPLEHLVLDLEDEFLETTTREDKAPERECIIPVTYEQALSFVYKDRAILALGNGKKKQAKKLAQEGLKLWNENPQLYAILASCTKDKKELDETIKLFEKFGRDNSVDLFDKYLLTGDPLWLEKTLQKYPTHANALSCKAQLLTDENPREAKWLFAVASKCYANSTELSMLDFYSNCRKELEKLFGKVYIARINDQLVDEINNQGN